MAHIFISHSSRNNDKAIEVRDWLAANGWTDVFLDLDPERGIVAGQRWKEALQKAACRCEVVLALVSPEWLASGWCKTEIDAARLMGKKVIVALVGTDKAQVPVDLTDEQFIDLSADPQAYPRLKAGLKRAGLDPTSFPFDPKRPPYPGLACLEEQDAAIFFGRDAQIVRGLDEIRRLVRTGITRMLVVLGASGSGKSSFLRAGLWPRLKRDDRAWLPLPILRPERAAISGKYGLAKALHQVMSEPRFAGGIRQRGLPQSRADIQDFLEKTDDGLEKLFAALRDIAQAAALSDETAAPPTILLALDQGEELFNEEGREEARRFIEILTKTLSADHPHALAILAMRSDSFPLVQVDPRLAALRKDTFTLDMMLEGSYRAVIEGPARLVEPPLRIDPQLTDALLKDISGQDALPLLAFTLAYLHEHYAAADNALTLAGYEKIGRVTGVIDKTVARAFAEAVARGEAPKDKDDQLKLARSAFIPHLAQVNAAGQSVRRVTAREKIPEGARALIDRFADQRLLIRDRRKDAEGHEVDVVEVAHEALLRQLPFSRWLKEDREFLVWRERLSQYRADFKANRRGLLAGRELAIARSWMQTRAEHEIEPADQAFIRESIVKEAAQQKRRKCLLVGALVVFALLAVAASGAAIFAYSNARRTKQALTDADFLQARDMVEQGKMDDALAHLARAVRTLPQNRAAIDRIFTLLAQRSFLLPASAPVQFSGRITSVRFTPEGRCLVATVSGAMAQVFDARSGQPATAPLQHDGSPVQMAELSPDAKFVATACGVSSDSEFQECGIWPYHRDEMPANDRQDAPGVARVWEVATGKLVSGPLKHDKAVLGVRFSHDGTRIVTASDDQTARVWDIRTGELCTPPLKHEARVLSAQFSPNDKRIIAVSRPSSIWDVETGKQIATADGALAAEYSPDGTRIAVIVPHDSDNGHPDQVLEIIDAETGKMIGKVPDAVPVITSVNFAPDGKRVLESFAARYRNKDDTGGIAETEVETGEPGESRSTEGIPVQCAVFAPQGKAIFAGLDDRTLRLWDRDRYDSKLESLVLPVKFPSTPFHLAFDPSGASLVAFFRDPQTESTWVQLWNLPTSTERSDIKSIPKQPKGPPTVPPIPSPAAPNEDQEAEIVSDTSRDGRRILKLKATLVTICDAKSGQQIGAQIRPEADYGDVGGMETAKFSPDGRLVATGEGGDFRLDKGFARIWDASTGHPLSAPLVHHKAVTSATFTSDNERLVTIESNLPKSDQSVVRVWDVRSGTPLTEVMPNKFASYSADFSHEHGQLTALSSGETETEGFDFAEVWDVAFPLNTHVPEWLPRLAEIVGGFQLNAQTGMLEPLSERWQQLEALRKELADSKAEDPFTAFGKWFLSNPTSRTISPFSKVTIAEYVDRCVGLSEHVLNQDRKEDLLNEAKSLAAGNDELLAKIAAASPSPAETPVETTPAPEGGPDATPRAAVVLVSPASNPPAPDYAQARQWYQKAADAGNADAKRALLRLASISSPTPASSPLPVSQASPSPSSSGAELFAEAKRYLDSEDYAQALQLLRKAADVGNPEAMNCLGNLYYNGQGITQDDTQARQWYQKAAEAGNADAKQALLRLPSNSSPIPASSPTPLVSQATTPAPEGGPDATPRAAVLAASNLPAPDDATALEQDAGAAAPDALRPRARGWHHHRPRPQPPHTFWQRLFALFGHEEPKPGKPRP